MSEVILKVKKLKKHFDISGGILDQIRFKRGKLVREQTIVKALNKVSFEVKRGEIFSVVGESGCGKSTLGRTILKLYEPDEGQIYFNNQQIDHLSTKQMLPFRTKMQMIFQDPYASLNPRKTVYQTLEEPVSFHYPHLSKAEVKTKIDEVMKQVGLDPNWKKRFPHEFSGGQRQRISIARALIVKPEFIVADEPISALDVSIQAQILNLLMEAQKQHNLSYLFITHDLAVVEHISTRVAVMYLGKICELAPTKDLFHNPMHPYTQALLSAIPKIGAQGLNYIKLKGEIPTPINLPSGCVFHPRCPYAIPQCEQEIPKLKKTNNSYVACHKVNS